MITIDQIKKISQDSKTPVPKVRKKLPKKDPIQSELKRIGDLLAGSISKPEQDNNIPLILETLSLFAKRPPDPVIIKGDRPREWEFHVSRDERRRILKVVAIAKEQK